MHLSPRAWKPTSPCSWQSLQSMPTRELAYSVGMGVLAISSSRYSHAARMSQTEALHSGQV